MGDLRTLTDRIDALLPQTQCGKCDYAGCRPYAEALAQGEADINQCPPGGQAGVDALARLLDRPSKPLDTAHGEEKPAPEVAVIIEADCIGCTLCIQACPVDAIVGASKQMHTVIETECTGCELCLSPCPVDCIEMVPVACFTAGELLGLRDLARARFQARNTRLARDRREREAARRQRRQRLSAQQTDDRSPSNQSKRDVIAAAVARARRRSGDTAAGTPPARGVRAPAIAAAIARARAAQARAAKKHGDEQE